MVPERVDSAGIFAGPGFDAAKLLGTRDALVAAGGIEGGLKVVGESEDEMNGAGRGRAQAMQRDLRQDAAGVGEFFLEAHGKFSVISYRCQALSSQF